MFVAFYKEYQHGRDRDNYSTMEIIDSSAIASETIEQLLNDMFDKGEYHRKSVKPKGEMFSYEYTSIEWIGVYEIDIKNTFYQGCDFNIDWDSDCQFSENDLLEMISSSEKGKKVTAEKERMREKQAQKRKEDAKVRKQKKIAEEQEVGKLKEIQDREEYERLKLKFEGEKS